MVLTQQSASNLTAASLSIAYYGTHPSTVRSSLSTTETIASMSPYYCHPYRSPIPNFFQASEESIAIIRSHLFPVPSCSTVHIPLIPLLSNPHHRAHCPSPLMELPRSEIVRPLPCIFSAVPFSCHSEIVVGMRS